jgi:hypothetical protein
MHKMTQHERPELSHGQPPARTPSVDDVVDPALAGLASHSEAPATERIAVPVPASPQSNPTVHPLVDAVRSDPQYAVAYNSRGFALAGEGKYELAVRQMPPARRACSAGVELYNRM